MTANKYKMAGRVIEIRSLHESVHRLCAAYATEEPADFTVTTSQEDIDIEREKSAREDKAEGRPVHSFSDGYLEGLAVYRRIAEQMIEYGTILFHGSAIAVDGEGYLFTAVSGTGKSTHTRLWREYLGERAVMVNDDKPLLRVTDSRVTVCGTPYNGKHGLGANISVPLKAVCVLTRAKENSIRRITRAEAYPTLLQQVYRPDDIIKMQKTLTLIDALADKAGLFLLGCNMDISAAKVAYEGMK